MAARVTCSEQSRSEILAFLTEELGALTERIGCPRADLSIRETEAGFAVEYPGGAIPTGGRDYVHAVPEVFRRLKERFPDTAIWGAAYAFETNPKTTVGVLFYCDAAAPELHVNFDWQECASCGRIHETDVFYNCSKRDLSVGNLMCLCTPTCVLSHSLDSNSEIQPNGFFTPRQREEIAAAADKTAALKALLWEKMTADPGEYMADYAAQKDRIAALAAKDGIPPEKKAVLEAILAKL